MLTACVSLLAGPIVGLSILAGTEGGASGLAAAVATLCQTNGPVAGLDPTQARNARSVVAVAQQVVVDARQSPAAQEQAELVALMTAATESTLHDYSNPKVPGSELLPNDGPPPSGGDHDSVGLFQQRASWGPLSSRMNPSVSARLFVSRLIVIPAWQSTPPGVVAQLVQGSAYPDRYARLQTAAQAWLQQIAGGSAAASCGGDGLTTAADGTIKPGTIPAGYSIPANATDAERRAVTFALAQLGKPYVFGAAGPDSYDCSGLTMVAWAAAGVVLPHYTVAQYQAGTPVAGIALLAPGDLIFIPGDDGSLTPPSPQHVGMYIGDNDVIEAPDTGDVIKIVPLAVFKPIIGIRRLG